MSERFNWRPTRRRKPLFPPQPSARTGRPVRNKGSKDVKHFTGNGIICIRRRIYWYRDEGHDERVDRWLGIADRNVSVAARELCCRVAMAGGVSFAKAVENLDRLGNIRIGREWLRQIVEGEGRAVVSGRTVILGGLAANGAANPLNNYLGRMAL